jgi:glycosyltransferase involved in cell wall biosynthesis
VKKILLVSPFPPAQNPRLLKEYTTLKSFGYDVTVIYGEKDKWSSDLINKNVKNFIRVGGKHGSVFHFATRIIHKLLKLISPVDWHYNRVNWLLYLRARNIKVDLYIGHNLAALPVVAKLAKKNQAKYGFDAEDFHRQVDNDNLTSTPYKYAKYLEDKYLRDASYITAASPLISQQYTFLYPALKPRVINNVFSNPHKVIRSAEPRQKKQKVKLFWFSQTIGKDRGIQTVIKAMGLLTDKNISLTLLGSVNTDTKRYLENLVREQQLGPEQLIFIAPIEPDEIFKIATGFDAGLALEPGFCLNNNIALSNKLFTYIAAGLAVIATETTAQRAFMENYPSIGKTFPIDGYKELADILEYYYQNPDLLNEAKVNSELIAAKELNWENESQKFIDVINKTLNH